VEGNFTALYNQSSLSEGHHISY